MRTSNHFTIATVVLTIILLMQSIQGFPSLAAQCPSYSTLHSTDALIVGGQNGTWFRPLQAPRLFEITLSNAVVNRLATFPSEGTIWSGSNNGTEWLISGWGNDPYGANPPIIIYDSSLSIIYSSKAPNSTSSWFGGDIFASSYGKHEWLLAGMGSGNLTGIIGNHMTLATFHHSNFTDLSSKIPNNQLGILYANQWNGSLWMVGGGFRLDGELFTFDGVTIHNLAKQITKSVRTFAPVTSLGWNGSIWLIGGDGFLATYDGHRFTDMTSSLRKAVGAFYGVNGISWDSQNHKWLLAGGSTRADVRRSTAWIATVSSTGDTLNLSSLLSCALKPATSSSILSSSFDRGQWALGGYATYGKRTSPILLVISLPDLSVANFAYALGDTTYVIWVDLTRGSVGGISGRHRAG